MNSFCDKPECQPGSYNPRFGVPLGHYEDDESEPHGIRYVSHEFDETNHPSMSERDRLREERQRNDPNHIREHGDTVFHGTSEAHAHDILRTGFHLDNMTNGRHSGHGVYTTTSRREAEKYGTHVVEARILRDDHHQDPWRDEEVHEHPSDLGKHAETVHHVIRGMGYIGHVDTDDPGTHVTYNPKHVVPVAVHATGIARQSSLEPHADHPNLSQYRSGGVGHMEGDESRSVVGMVPLHALEPLREHDGIQNPNVPGRDRKIIDGIRSDLRSGHGLEEPIQVFHDPKRHHGYIGEGNHRLAALREEGHTHAPVRVHSRSNNSDRVEDGIGGPLHMATNFDQGDYPYTPPDVHPHHFREFRP